MPRKQRRPIDVVFAEARQALSMSQEKFGYAVGASHRTAVRWDAGTSTPSDHHVRKLAEVLHPHNRVLAAEVADFLDETLESLGLEVPPPPATPPLAPAPSPALVPSAEDLIDVVVLAAMEITGSSSADVRPLLHAIFKRAKDVGLTVELAEQALRPMVAGKDASDGTVSDTSGMQRSEKATGPRRR
jgi:DNA-binding XRE family transcriptional regulator